MWISKQELKAMLDFEYTRGWNHGRQDGIGKIISYSTPDKAPQEYDSWYQVMMSNIEASKQARNPLPEAITKEFPNNI